MADTAVRINTSSPGYLEDPFAAWSEVRESDPLYRDPTGIFHVTRYADVWSLLRDRRCGRDLPPEVARLGIGDGEATNRFFEKNMLGIEGPEHTRLRRLMAQPFTPKRIRTLEAQTARLVDELLDPLDEQFDLAAEFALILPVLVICDLLGLPREDRALVRPWADTLASTSTMFPNDEQKAAAESAFQSFWNYFDDMVSGRRPYAPDGLFAAMVTAEDEGGRLSREELIVNASLLFFAGFETTTNLIGDGMLALLRNPEQLERLRRDGSLLPTAVEEMLRYDSPVQSAARFTHEAIEVSDGTIKAGRVITLWFAAANRDPRRFPDPDAFDVGREDNDHLAFGNGTHFCLGAHLARLETRVAVDAFTTRFRSIELDGPYVRKPSAALRGLSSLPVRVSRR